MPTLQCVVAPELNLLDGTPVVTIERLSELIGTPVRMLRIWARQGQIRHLAVVDDVRYYRAPHRGQVPA